MGEEKAGGIVHLVAGTSKSSLVSTGKRSSIFKNWAISLPICRYFHPFFQKSKTFFRLGFWRSQNPLSSPKRTFRTLRSPQSTVFVKISYAGYFDFLCFSRPCAKFPIAPKNFQANDSNAFGAREPFARWRPCSLHRFALCSTHPSIFYSNCITHSVVVENRIEIEQISFKYTRHVSCFGLTPKLHVGCY